MPHALLDPSHAYAVLIRQRADYARIRRHYQEGHRPLLHRTTKVVGFAAAGLALLTVGHWRTACLLVAGLAWYRLGVLQFELNGYALGHVDGETVGARAALGLTDDETAAIRKQWIESQV